MIEIPSVKITGDSYIYMKEEPYNLILKSKTISAPKPQRHLVQIPGRNGSVDLARYISDQARYDDRDITMTFEKQVLNYKDLINFISMLENKIGNWYETHFVFDEDPLFEYIGRVTSLSYKWLKSGAEITIKASVLPYKYLVGTNRIFDNIDVSKINNGYISNYMMHEVTDREVIEIDNSGAEVSIPRAIRVYNSSSRLIIEGYQEGDTVERLDVTLKPGESMVIGEKLAPGLNTVIVKPAIAGSSSVIDLIYTGGAI